MAQALLSQLRALLGDEAVVDGAGGDADPRTARHVSGLDVGAPIAWVRPTSTEACASVVRAAGAHGVRVAVVADATTFWDGLRVGGALALDARALGGSVAVDQARRVALAGAGASVAEVDRAARRHGLCLVAYPDASGETTVGSLVAVGCTAGLGLGRALPVEQVAGVTAVTGAGEILRLGASHGLGAAPFARAGRRDLLDLVLAAQGEGVVVTEVGLLLEKASPLSEIVLRAPVERRRDPELLRGALRAAELGMDEHVLDSCRLELGLDREGRGRLELLLRAHSSGGASSAAAHASRLAEVAAEAGWERGEARTETDAALRGEAPDYFFRFAVPRGEHRARLEGGAFWGVEVTASRGPEVAACMSQLLDLLDACESLAPVHRRIGVYPGRHSVSVGLQVLGTRAPGSIEALRGLLEGALPDLLSLGVVPYREGHLWRGAMTTFAGQHPAEARRAELVRRCAAVLDPHGVLSAAGARGA